MERKIFFKLQAEKIRSEIELALHWKTPIIIAVIYSTSHVLVDMKNVLTQEFSVLEKRFVPILLNEDNPNLVELIKDFDFAHSVFSVTGLNNGGGQDQANAYRFLNYHREYFIENNVRLLLWLRPEEFQQMALFSPDFWAFRHSVIDLTRNRATPKRSSYFQGISLLKFPWELSFPDIENALRYRKEMLSEIPNTNEALAIRINLYGEIAGLYFQKSELTKASTMLSEALEIIPHGYLKELKSKLLAGMAILSIEEGNPLQAEVASQQAVVQSKLDPYYLTILAHSRRLNGRNAEALADSLRAVRLMPTDASGWNELGNIYLNLGRFNEGMDAYKNAYTHSNDQRILINQAMLFLSIGRLVDAKECIKDIPCETLKLFIDLSHNSTRELLEKLC